MVLVELGRISLFVLHAKAFEPYIQQEIPVVIIVWQCIVDMVPEVVAIDLLQQLRKHACRQLWRTQFDRRRKKFATGRGELHVKRPEYKSLEWRLSKIFSCTTSSSSGFVTISIYPTVILVFGIFKPNVTRCATIS